MDTAHEHKVLLADVEVGWNFSQHINNVLPHYHRFGVMPNFIGYLPESPRLSECVALMNITRQETESFHARLFISRAQDSHHRHIVPFKSFSIHEKYDSLVTATDGIKVLSQAWTP